MILGCDLFVLFNEENGKFLVFDAKYICEKVSDLIEKYGKLMNFFFFKVDVLI